MEQIRAMKSLFQATIDKTRGVVRPLLQRRKAPAFVPPPPRPSGDDKSYAAVAVRPCKNACQAALALAHQRLLKNEAPESLPLPGCTNPGCRCRLETFHDRRAAGERRSRGDEADSDLNDANRRLPGDRRINKQRARPTAYFNDY
ncbi:MAG: hypothetical protein ACN4GT_14920 [Gammaproteobacteria bacterium]